MPAASTSPAPPIRISVIIPVYNGGDEFRRCLDALATTNIAACEVIVVDDGSTDNSTALAERRGYSVLHTDRPRSGPAAARNQGAHAAAGDVLFFVDADVAVQPSTVAQVAHAFADDPTLDALFGSYDDAPGAANFLSQYKNLFHHYVHQHSSEQAASFWSGCGAMRREVFLRYGGFDTALYRRPCIEDIELGYRVTRDGGCITLDKSLQVKHLKRWTARSLLRSDVLDRGIPWSRLLLREKAFANDLNLQTHNRASVAAVYLLLLALVAGLWTPWAWPVAAGAAALLLTLNWPLYRWFAGMRGWRFALAVVPWHWFYYFYNGISFGVGLAWHGAQSLGHLPARRKSLLQDATIPGHLAETGRSSYSRWVFWGVVVAILLAAWALRLYRLDFQDIWWDEARNIDVAGLAISRVASSPQLDIHPPLYFYGLHLWLQAASKQAFATRFLSVWFGMLAVALTYRLARELAPGKHGQLAGLLALLLASSAAYGLAEAQETRMYTMSWALLAAGMLAMWRATGRHGISGWRQIGWWALFAVLAAAALMTHYSTAIILTTWAAWLLLWALQGPDRGKRMATLAGVALATVILLLPVVPVALRQIPGYDNPNLNLPDLGLYLAQLYRAFTLGEFAPAQAWTISRWLWLALPLGGVAVALLAHSGSTKATRWRRLAALLFWLFGGLILYYAILVSRPAFDPRYISFVLPPLWAAAGWALAQWETVARPAPWLAAGALVMVAVPSLHSDLTNPRAFREDTSGVVSWLQHHATPDDVVLVDQAYPFGFYWQRWNPNPDQPPAPDVAGLAPAYYVVADAAYIDEQLSELAGHARQVFWVTWYESDTDPKGLVRDLLDANGQALGSQDFRGYNVAWWQLDKHADFRLPGDFQSLNLDFEPGVKLVDGDWQGRTAAASQAHPALVALRWQAQRATAQPLKVSLRLKDPAGNTVAQNDRLMLSDRHLRTTDWPPGETALDLYSLPLADVRPGVYDLSVVVYDEETLVPVSLSNDGGIEPVIGRLQVAESRQ